MILGQKKLEGVEPAFRDKILKLLKKVEGETERKWGCSDGRRTMKEQEAIYAQGRTKPGKVVSNAKPGQSAHNFGLAVDLWPLTADGKDFDWGANQRLFKKLADEAQSMGLTAGFYFKSIHDAPHIEDPSWKEKQALWKEGKLSIA